MNISCAGGSIAIDVPLNFLDSGYINLTVKDRVGRSVTIDVYAAHLAILSGAFSAITEGLSREQMCRHLKEQQ